jgi:hypothetical protein
MGFDCIIRVALQAPFFSGLHYQAPILTENVPFTSYSRSQHSGGGYH